MTSEQRKVSEALAEDGFPMTEEVAGAVLHRIEGEICAAIDSGGGIDLVRPTGRGMVPIEADEVPHRFMERVMLGLRSPSKLVGGMIPARTACPFRERCAVADTCHHKGPQHDCDFSCAIARGLDLSERRLGSSRPGQGGLTQDDLSFLDNPCAFRRG